MLLRSKGQQPEFPLDNELGKTLIKRRKQRQEESQSWNKKTTILHHNVTLEASTFDDAPVVCEIDANHHQISPAMINLVQ